MCVSFPHKSVCPSLVDQHHINPLASVSSCDWLLCLNWLSSIEAVTGETNDKNPADWAPQVEKKKKTDDFKWKEKWTKSNFSSQAPKAYVLKSYYLPLLWGQPPQLLGVMKCREKDSGFNNLASWVFSVVRLYSKLLQLAGIINSGWRRHTDECLHECGSTWSMGDDVLSLFTDVGFQFKVVCLSTNKTLMCRL